MNSRAVIDTYIKNAGRSRFLMWALLCPIPAICRDMGGRDMRSEDGLMLEPGMRVGLLGGSFDPPHAGHLHLSKEALKRFGLDRVIWLVSPGNPLKADAPAGFNRRLKAARDLVDHPCIQVSDFEARTGTRHTARTIAELQAHWPGVRFVWLMGADNLAQFHLWQDWRDIMRRVPVGVLARPGMRLAARGSVAARIFRDKRLQACASQLLGRAKAPRWCSIPLRRGLDVDCRRCGKCEPDKRAGCLLNARAWA